jgi:hypothetical protein
MNMPGTHNAVSWKTFGAQIWTEQRRWLILRLVCAIVWAVELFWFQGVGYENNPMGRHPIIIQSIRWHLDFVMALTLSFLLPRRWLFALFLWSLFFHSVVGTYSTYFHRPLMPMTAYYQWREAVGFGGNLQKLVPLSVLATALGAFILKLGLLVGSGRVLLPRRLRWQWVAMAVMFYLLPVSGLQTTRYCLLYDFFPNHRVFAYGYTLPWIKDLTRNRSLSKHAQQAQAYTEVTYDRITPLEKPLAITNDVVVLQLETVCNNAIEALYQGRPVMPFLRALKGQSMFFRIQCFHRNGSCDMDFAALTFSEPYPYVNSYLLPGMRYTRAMPEFMKQHGYRTHFLHNYSEHFFNRGPLIQQVGFDQIRFSEQLGNGQRVRDHDLFRHMLQAFERNTRNFVFGITFDTHLPYDFIEPSEMEIFPNPKNLLENYFNSIRYLDSCLAAFFKALPPHTTVLMYGDHSSSLKAGDFEADLVNGVEHVACLISQKGADLSRFQQTRNQPIATDGSLNLLDVVGYLRHSVATSKTPAGKL